MGSKEARPLNVEGDHVFGVHGDQNWNRNSNTGITLRENIMPYIYCMYKLSRVLVTCSS
jgi:hypothetical protein